MKVGDLVKLNDDNETYIRGIIVEVHDDMIRNDRMYYTIRWFDDMAEISTHDEEDVMVLSANR